MFWKSETARDVPDWEEMVGPWMRLYQIQHNEADQGYIESITVRMHNTSRAH